MLIRVSGKMSDGTPFASRVEASSAIDAVTLVGKKLVEAGKTTDMVAEIIGKPVTEAAGVHFGTAKTADEIASAKQKRADNKAKKAADVVAAAVAASKAKK